MTSGRRRPVFNQRKRLVEYLVHLSGEAGRSTFGAMLLRMAAFARGSTPCLLCGGDRRTQRPGCGFVVGDQAELEAARNERDVARQEARHAELESAEEMEMMETALSGIEAKLARALADANQAKEDRDLLRIELSSVKCKLGVAEATIAGLRSDDFQRPGVPSTIRGWQRAAHALAVEKGWHPEDGPDPRDPNRALAWLMLASSELAEAAEEVRAGRWEQWTEESGKPAGVGVEVADCVIRLLDSCEAWGIDLQARIEDKHEYNKTRPHRHGGKSV